MSEIDQVRSPPRVIIELQADGSLVCEIYINGSRRREPVTKGFEGFEIREALNHLQRQREAYAKQKAEEVEKLIAARHKRVRKTMEQTRGQGVDFAAKIMGPVPSGRQGHADTAIADLERVCHCGKLVEPFMEKCVGCPGHSGAGKQLKGEAKSLAKKREIQAMIDLL